MNPITWTKQKWRAFRAIPLHKKIILITTIVVGSLVLGALITTLIFANSLGSKDKIMNRNSTGVTLLDKDDKPFYEFYNARSDTRVPLANVSDVTQKALISSEDKGFYDHQGFSLTGIANAIWQNIQPGGEAGGGSTLTQQLVKNALLTQDRNLLRKYQELVLSIEIERRYSKDEILEMYLNSVYFGEGAFGIEDAAQTYFAKPAKDLNLAEATMLVGLLPAPSVYSPVSGDPTKAKKRQNYVLERMVEDKKITQAEADAASATELAYAPPKPEEAEKAPHFAEMVRKILEEKYGEEVVARSGFKVKTTLNLDWQTKAENAVKTQVAKLAYGNVTNGAAVILDPKTGQVAAVVGSKDWNDESFGKFNVADVGRQPGSSFKPIVYATGIENKELSAATILNDKKTDFGGGYSPNNYDLKFRGDVTVRRALANSLNVPAVEALQKVGISDTLQTAKDLGITTLDKPASSYDLSMALGTGQIKLTELTNAYATFGNQGKHNDLEMILSITDKSNNEIYTAQPTSKTAVDLETAYIMSSILSDNAARAETFGSSLNLSGGRIAAVKTGTTEDYRDALTVGYTPSLAIGVWVGNNDNSPMTSVGGSVGSGPIWRQLMNEILAGTPVEKFSQPSGLSVKKVCYGSGAVAEYDGPSNTYTEYFRSGTVPTKTCNTNKPKEEEPVTTPTPTPAPTETTPPSSGSSPPEDDEDETTTPGTTNPGSGTSPGTGTGDGGTAPGSGSGGNNGGSTNPTNPVTPPVTSPTPTAP